MKTAPYIGQHVMLNRNGYEIARPATPEQARAAFNMVVTAVSPVPDPNTDQQYIGIGPFDDEPYPLWDIEVEGPMSLFLLTNACVDPVPDVTVEETPYGTVVRAE